MDFDAVYYEPASLSFELGKQLKEQFMIYHGFQ